MCFTSLQVIIYTFVHKLKRTKMNIVLGQGLSNDTESFYSDLWGFDLGSQTWSRLDSNSSVVPEGRWGQAGGILGEEFVIAHGKGAEIRYDDTGYAQNTATPIFDVAYPPIGECINLTDEQFKDEIFFSIFNNEERRSTKCQIVIGKSCVPIGNGVPCSLGHIACDCEDRSDEEQEMVVMGMMKRATYAYLVAKLSC